LNALFGKLFKQREGETVSSLVTRPSTALYLAGLVVQISSLLIVARQLSDLRFGYFAIILSMVGAASAYYLRLRQIPKRYIQYGVLAVGILFFMAFRNLGFFAELLPAEAQGSQELTIVSGLALASAFCTFLWLSDESVVFTCVWAIAIVGLTGTVNINLELIVGFIVFLAAAVFLLIHQNAIFQSDAHDAPTVEDSWFSGLSMAHIRPQLIIALMVWGAALVMGFLIAIPVQMLGRNLSLNAILQRLRVPPAPVRRALGGRSKLTFDNLNQFNVGLGPIDDDPSERMYALTDEPRYWRGRIYDQYTGQAWVNTLEMTAKSLAPTASSSQNEVEEFTLLPLTEKRLKTSNVTHKFHLVDGIFGPLYHAAEPKAVRAPVLAIVQRSDNTIGTGRGMGADYEVDSEVTDPIPSDLRFTGSKYPSEITDRYLNLGASNDALAQLTREAVGNATNPYDKTQAIRRFVAARCIYTREARAVPRDRDAAEFFLNESREGYCDLYATSLTMLCRYAGIPARVVTGFAPGSPAPSGSAPPIVAGDKRQWYLLRGSDLHAWTEVYFVGYGWVPFDATTDTGGTTTPTQTPPTVVKANPLRDFWRNGGVTMVFVGLATCTLIAVLLNEWRSRMRQRKVLYATGKGEAAEVARVYRKTIRKLERRGAPFSVTTTPSEYLRQSREIFNESVTSPLAELTAIVEMALYSSVASSSHDVQNAVTASKAALSALRSHPKIEISKEVAYGDAAQR